MRRGLAGRMARLERELASLERRLMALQGRYEDAAGELASLRSLERQLAKRGLRGDGSASWLGVSRALGLLSPPGSAHRAVKKHDPALHSLMHRILLGAYCPLDRTTYAR